MLTIDFFRGKRVTVFGLGLNQGGVGTVLFLLKNGVKEVIVTDIKSKEDLAPSLLKLATYKNVTYILGQHRSEDFTNVDLVIKNPLISWTNEYVKSALKKGVPVEMDSSLFFALCPKVPIIGITGTKGKTTTATLIAHILKKAGKKVVTAGIGRIGVLDKLEFINKESVVVFELSSWRLSALHRLQRSPSIALVTNLYPDHLNYYKTMEEYAWDKEAIFSYQKTGDKAVFNAENPLVVAMSERAKGEKYFFGVEGNQQTNVFIRDENVYCTLEGHEEKLFPLSLVKLIGRHNIENVLAATLVTKVYGLSNEAIREGVATFIGVPHRMEFIETVNGVDYINDTAATIPDAAIATLESIEKPIILLAGGSDKKLALEQFAEKMLERAKAIFLFKGEATNRLLTLLHTKDPEREVVVVEDMEKAVLAASRLAKPGETVLLSPGAASFGLFQNEFDRGEKFRAAVKKLSNITH